jgi:hypothetical protein
MRHIQLFENFSTLNEEEYDFISDFQRTEGRRPTRDEIDRLYYGKGKIPEGPAVEYPQHQDYRGIKVGDKVKNKKTGEIFTVTRAPYHKIVDVDRWGYPDHGEGAVERYGIQAISVEDSNGKIWADKKENYEKILSAAEEIEKNKVVSSDNVQIDMITKGLIDRGLFGPQEVPSGKMLDSFNDQKLAHNEDIRKAIDQIAKEENSIKYSIKDRYWNQFW